MMTLYTPPNYHKTNRVLIAAEMSGVKLTVKPYSEDIHTSNKKFPIVSCPLFESSNGEVALFESNAIAYFVSNDQLKASKNVANSAKVIDYLTYVDSVIVPAMATVVYPSLGIVRYNKNDSDKAKTALTEILNALNTELSTKTFLVGERITLADIAVYTALEALFETQYTADVRNGVPHVTRFITTIGNNPSVKKSLGKPNGIKLCEQALPSFDNAKFQALHDTSGDKNKGQSTQKDGKKKESNKPAAQQEKKDRTPKKSEAEEEPKDKDPFAEMPKGNFNLEAFKKIFSNQDIEKEVLPFFWQNFEPKNYSIWECVYDYNSDLKMDFMACNLVGGMQQRLDRMRKHALGMQVVFGENYKLQIRGLWVWLGQDLIFKKHKDLQVDFESYTWTKLDPNAQTTKDLVKAYFLDSKGNYGSDLKYNDAKVFK